MPATKPKKPRVKASPGVERAVIDLSKHVKMKKAQVAAEVAAEGAVIATRVGTNLKTLPPLMFNPAVQIANVCLSARDAHHDGGHGIQINPLFMRVQQEMFGARWAQVCQTTFGSRGDVVSDNGTWLSAAHSDILWTRTRELTSTGTVGVIVPRFGMRLEAYNLENCIRAVTRDGGVVDFENGPPFTLIVDNLNLGSPSKKKPTPASTTYRIVTTSEIFDRAGRSIHGIDRLGRLKKWWSDSVEGATPDLYPPIHIPLNIVGEITSASVLQISLFLDNLVRFDVFKSDETMRFDIDGIHGIVKAVLLYRFHIPGVTDGGVPGVVNIGTVEQPMFTYDTYVFIHTNGSVSYSRPVDGVNYPDNTEKNRFYILYSAAAAAADMNLVRQGVLYNICKSIGDSCAVWTASVNTFIHTTDTGLIIRCIFNDRFCVAVIVTGGVRKAYLISPDLAADLFNVHGVPIPRSPKPETVEVNIPVAKGKRNSTQLLFKGVNRLLDASELRQNLLPAAHNAPPKPRHNNPFTLILRSRVSKFIRPGVGGGDGIQQGGALFTVPNSSLTNNPKTTLNELLTDEKYNNIDKVIFKGNQITNLNETLLQLGITPGSKLMLSENKTSSTAPSQVNPSPLLLKISSDACRYFQTLLLYIVSFYSDTPVDDSGINNFALPESKDVVVVFTDDVSNSGVSNVVANPFQDNVVTKPVIKFISFTELPTKIQEFLTLLNAFVKVFVSNIALITKIQIPPKQRVMPETPTTSSVEGEMEIKLNLIRTIISRILGNRGGDGGGGDGGDDSGVNGIQTDLREVSRACLFPSVLLRIDDPNIKKGYLDAYNTSKVSKVSTLGATPSNDLGVPNFFYLPNATSNVFDIVDNIVEYFGPVFSNSYDGDGIVFEKLPVILPEVKAGVVDALEHFKRDSRLYTIPMQIKFNTHAVSSAKIFDNICEIINGNPLSDPLNAELKKYIEERLSTEKEKLKTLTAIKKEGGESGKGNSSLSEEIRNNIEDTARDNVLSAFITEMANYFVDGEMEDFEKDSMKALIDLNATYGFDVKGNDFLHLNDIVYKIFVQEIMYTGAHIYRVDFLQDFINNIGFNTGQLNYMDNINDALAANGTISNEQLTELKIKGYSLSDIIGLLYELRDKTTESSSEEKVTSVINGFLGQEVSSLPKVMKTGIDIGSIPSQPIRVEPTPVSVATGGRGGRKNNKKTNNKYDTKRRAIYKKFVDKYIIIDKKRGKRGKRGKRDNVVKGTRKNKKMNASATTRKNINKKSSHYVKNKNSKKNKKNKKVNHRSNLYKMNKRNKTLRHD